MAKAKETVKDKKANHERELSAPALRYARALETIQYWTPLENSFLSQEDIFALGALISSIGPAYTELAARTQVISAVRRYLEKKADSLMASPEMKAKVSGHCLICGEPAKAQGSQSFANPGFLCPTCWGALNSRFVIRTPYTVGTPGAKNKRGEVCPACGRPFNMNGEGKLRYGGFGLCHACYAKGRRLGTFDPEKIKEGPSSTSHFALKPIEEDFSLFDGADIPLPPPPTNDGE